MFTSTVKVPRITAANLAAFEAIAPGYAKVGSVPRIETAEQAVKEATTLAEKSLVRYEYIKEVKEVTTTPEGWTVSFSCGGD